MKGVTFIDNSGKTDKVTASKQTRLKDLPSLYCKRLA